MQNVYTPRDPLRAVSRYSAAPRRGSPASAPYCARSIIACGCSTRTPTANAFGCMATPAWNNIRYVSRAPWPMARTSAAQGIRSSRPPHFTRTPLSVPPSCSRPQSVVEKRTSPPIASIFCRRWETTSRRRSVPICGLARYAISAGAPCSTSTRSTLAARGSLMRVVSFPSENVPAPPSPNMTLLSGSNAPPLQKRCTSAVRSDTGLPRSTTSGWYPCCARQYAANSPAGPNPATSMRPRGSSVPCATGAGTSGANLRMPASPLWRTRISCAGASVTATCS